MGANSLQTRNRTLVAGALLLLFAALAYGPLLRAGFIWDDDSYVTANKTLRDASGLRRIWTVPEATPQYYPLVHTSFWVEYHLWVLNPLGYHIVNILLHALAAFLLYIVLSRLRVPGAWLSAAIFTLHPVEVETVAWVTERKNLLSAVFYLAAAFAYLRFKPVGDGEVSGRHRWGWYSLSLICFVGALFSKTVACSLPAALLLIYWWKTGRVRWKDVLLLLPFFCVGLALGLGTAWLEKTHVHAEGPEWDLTIVQRCLIAGRALWFYTSKIVWPHPLTFIYPRWTIDPSQLWQWIFPTAAGGVIVALWALRTRIGRGPLTGVLFFVGTLAPALGFINVYPMRYSFVADHFQYLASIGLIVLAACALSRMPVWTPVPVLVLLGVLTWHQTGIYRSAETVWRATLRDNPTASIARNNLSQILLGSGDIDQAIELSREVLAVKPDPVAELNLGYGLLQKGRLDEAIAHCRQSIAEQPNNPEAYYDIGQACLKKSQFDASITNFQMATSLRPDYAAAFCNLGYALLQTGRVRDAVAHYEQSIALDPHYALPYNDLGSIELRLGQTNDALSHFQRAAELAPQFVEAHYNLASLLLAEGKLEEARKECERVVDLRPGLAQAHYLMGKLGSAYAQRGRIDKAVLITKHALQLAQAAHETDLTARLSQQLQSYPTR